uniref:CHK domain-containing protein n=1 Tax=Rhabditophanes sp. KR3021 TaxID=114890 RepID=A0AC35U2G6_9BILA
MSIFATQQLEDSNVEGTKTEIKWVIECLEEKNRDFKSARGNAKVTKVDASHISGGKGFASKVYKLTIYFDDKSKKPFIIALKIPGMDSMNEALENQKMNNDGEDEMINSDLLAKAHDRECKFYNQFTQIPDLKIVKCYGSRDWTTMENQEGALIMDFLASSTNNQFVYSLNIHQARNCLKEVHNLQAYFFSLPSKQWQNEYTIIFGAEEFEKMSPILAINWAKIRTFVPNELFKDYEEDILSLTDSFGQVLRFISNDLVNLEGNIKCFVHNDLWSNNVTYTVDSDGNPGNEIGAIIDWQIPYCGCIGVDIARVIVTGCSPEIRREIETVDLPKYYDSLKMEIINRGGSFEMTWEMFKLNYDFCMIEQSMDLLIMYSFALQNYSVPEEAGDYLWDARKYALGSRITFALIDAVKKCRLIKPEWLIKKVEE